MATAELTRQQLLIGGAWTDAGSGDSYEQTFPYTGEPVGIAAAAGRSDAHDAVDVALAAGMLREAAAQAYGLVGEVIPSDVPGKLAMGVRQPAGVVVAIAPRNAPVILSTRAVAMPLAYGNTVVLKASELCPRTHAVVVHALQDAGLPPGVINLITNDPADDAVRVANDTEYGLSAAVFSENVPAALELAQRIESGICHVNDTTVQDEPQMPFGGVKASGWGRFGGRAALEEFTELRWITVQSLARQYPI
jgi:acyl-CoA reductase-like NAD-dependent aldehyde dehydrogenase